MVDTGADTTVWRIEAPGGEGPVHYLARGGRYGPGPIDFRHYGWVFGVPSPAELRLWFTPEDCHADAALGLRLRAYRVPGDAFARYDLDTARILEERERAGMDRLGRPALDCAAFAARLSGTLPDWAEPIPDPPAWRQVAFNRQAARLVLDVAPTALYGPHELAPEPDNPPKEWCPL